MKLFTFPHRGLTAENRTSHPWYRFNEHQVERYLEGFLGFRRVRTRVPFLGVLGGRVRFVGGEYEHYLQYAWWSRQLVAHVNRSTTANHGSLPGLRKVEGRTVLAVPSGCEPYVVTSLGQALVCKLEGPRYGSLAPGSVEKAFGLKRVAVDWEMTVRPWFACTEAFDNADAAVASGDTMKVLDLRFENSDLRREIGKLRHDVEKAANRAAENEARLEAALKESADRVRALTPLSARAKKCVEQLRVEAVEREALVLEMRQLRTLRGKSQDVTPEFLERLQTLEKLYVELLDRVR